MGILDASIPNGPTWFSAFAEVSNLNQATIVTETPKIASATKFGRESGFTQLAQILTTLTIQSRRRNTHWR